MENIKIDIKKTTGNSAIIPEEKDIIEEMNDRIQAFCNYLLVDNDKFDEEKAFDILLDYISKYDRILYSPISNTIYAYYNEHDENDATNKMGTISSNIIDIVAFSQGENISRRIEVAAKSKQLRQVKNLKDTRKAILKIWDHINLAQQQYSVLKLSDEDYNKKIDKMFTPKIDELSKDLNSQLLTMIGIFTALAFLIFGGISSLDNIFSNANLPLLKIMIIGSIWGLSILNLVFVFLFCVGKMTKLNFASSNDDSATIFQKYPIVWWSNFIIVSTLLMSIWAYYLTRRDIHIWIDQMCVERPICVTIFGTIILGGAIFIAGRKLVKVTKVTVLKNK